MLHHANPHFVRTPWWSIIKSQIIIFHFAGEMTSDFFRIVNEARSHSLGPFSPSFNIQTCLLEGMSRHLPEDAHLRVNGKLHISLTRVYDGKSVIVSQFNSRQDLLDALLCACFIPGFSGILPPKFHGVRYMDGAFSDNLPTLDENTVTVSPFGGESDICPRDDTAQIFHVSIWSMEASQLNTFALPMLITFPSPLQVNLANTSIEISKQNVYRFVRILFPPKLEILSNMCQQGFDDALHFLHRNNLISCTRCLAIQSTFVLSKQTPEHYDPECSTCSVHRIESLDDPKMPETVISAMEKYIIKNSSTGVFKWFQSPALFLLRTITLPVALPVDFVSAVLSRFVKTPIHIIRCDWCLEFSEFSRLHQLLRIRCGISRSMFSTIFISFCCLVKIVSTRWTTTRIRLKRYTKKIRFWSASITSGRDAQLLISIPATSMSPTLRFVEIFCLVVTARHRLARITIWWPQVYTRRLATWKHWIKLQTLRCFTTRSTHIIISMKRITR